MTVLQEHIYMPQVQLFSLSKVSHHPPAAAHHAISDRGWTLRQEITVASKFRGKYLSIMPLGENSLTWNALYVTLCAVSRLL